MFGSVDRWNSDHSADGYDREEQSESGCEKAGCVMSHLSISLVLDIDKQQH